MKSTFAALTERELKSTFSVKKFNIKKFDFLGLLLTLVIIAALGTAYVLVLKGLISNYVTIKFNDTVRTIEEQIIDRQVELLTLSYTVIIVAGVLFGVGAINKSITYDKDTENLLRLPVTTQEIFLSKIISLYFSQMVFMSVLILPVNLTFHLAVAQGAWFWIATVITCLLLPAIPFLLASLLSLPAKYVSNWLKTKYWLLSLLFILLLAGAFWLYSQLLVYIEELFVSGKIKIIFNKTSVDAIVNISKFSYPARWYANFVYSQGTLLNLLFALLATAAAIALVYLFTLRLFNSYILQGARIKRAFNVKRKARVHTPFTALMRKELITVVRTPDYAFSYLSTAFVMPLMVYCCAQLLDKLIMRLIGFSFAFEISLLCITMFAVLTNTFCAGNISRDGELFLINKSLPTSSLEYVGAKMLFCFIVGAISVIASAVVLAFTEYVTWLQCILTIVSALLIVTGEIMIATRRDLAHPKFDLISNPDANSRTVSFVIVVGLFISVVIAVAAVALNVYLTSIMKVELAKMELIQTAVIIALSVLVCGLSALFLFCGLRKKIDKTVS